MTRRDRVDWNDGLNEEQRYTRMLEEFEALDQQLAAAEEQGGGSVVIKPRGIDE